MTHTPEKSERLLHSAADLLQRYCDYIHDEVRADDLERHPYLPEIEQSIEDLRAGAAELARRDAEIAGLREQVDSWKALSSLSTDGLNVYVNIASITAVRSWLHSHGALEPIRTELLKRAETAKQELARCRVDAARYAWLRSDALMYEDGNNPTPWCVTGTDSKDSEPAFGDELDAAIDAAMASGRDS